MQKFWASVAMILATVLWGVAFSVQRSGNDHMEPMSFIAMRSITGVAALCVIIMVFDLFRYKRVTLWGSAKTPQEKRDLLLGGFWCGLVLTVASACQQYGLKDVSAGKSGFLTALYIVIVPLLGLLFKRKMTWLLWLAVGFALGGSYLLCGGIGSIGTGEWYVIACAVIFSGHIMVTDLYAPKCDCIRLSCLQFLTATILAGAASLVLNDPWTAENVLGGMPFWLFCGIGSSAIAFTLQIVCQKYLHPVTATLLMSLESVFAVVGAWLFLHEILTIRELAGCAVIFIGIILAQLPAATKTTVPAKTTQA